MGASDDMVAFEIARDEEWRGEDRVVCSDRSGGTRGGADAVLLLVLSGGDVCGVRGTVCAREEVEGSAEICGDGDRGGVGVARDMAVGGAAYVLWLSR